MAVAKFQICIIKTSVDFLIADIYTDTYIKTEIDTLI